MWPQLVASIHHSGICGNDWQGKHYAYALIGEVFFNMKLTIRKTERVILFVGYPCACYQSAYLGKARMRSACHTSHTSNCTHQSCSCCSRGSGKCRAGARMDTSLALVNCTCGK